jgi:hypothetical protein
MQRGSLLGGTRTLHVLDIKELHQVPWTSIGFSISPHCARCEQRQFANANPLLISGAGVSDWHTDARRDQCSNSNRRLNNEEYRDESRQPPV